MQIVLHISFPGTCEEAFHFYRQCLGGEISSFVTWGESPVAHMVPPEWGAKVCHATLSVDGAVLTGVDSPPHEYKAPSGFQILLRLSECQQATEIFAALSAGGNVTFPLQKTFWSACYGIVTDKFGITWEVQAQTAPEQK
jgi:PhnB protein